MDILQLENIRKSIKQIAFYQDENGNYRPDMVSLEPANQKMLNYLSEVEGTQTKHRQQLKQKWDEFLTSCNSLVLSEDAFSSYTNRNNVTEQIQHYFDIQSSLRYAVIKFIGSNTIDNRDRYRDADDMTKNTTDENGLLRNTNKPEKSKQVILNHNNPFADITIENQNFLYPNKDGIIQSLNFNIGYTMTKIENEESEILALQPGFKISKSEQTNIPRATITMDDTISTPMPDSNGDKLLVYI